LDAKNSRILADTSVWIEFFRPKAEAGNKLEKLISVNSVWTCGVVLYELTQGVRSESDKKSILDIFSSLQYVEMTASLWQKAGELSSVLRRKGINLPFSDIVIAAITIEHNLSVFTLEKHFEKIPGVRVCRF
jgi:predicted nucleic acid-binding protein